ncbi:MAG: FG-GAP repeat domain-containing protein, partial [Victivallaceae bacterium]
FTLDGRELPQQVELKTGEVPQFTAVSLGRHQLAAGRHTLTLRPGAESGDWALGGLALGRRENRFSIGTGLDAEPELRRVLLTGPDGGAPVPGYTGSFVTLKTLAKGRATGFFTLLRPGVETDRIAAAGPDGRTALKLPEKALAIPSGDGFLLVERDHLSGWRVAEVAGLFKRPAPVAFDYDAETGKLAVLEADNRVTQTVVKNFSIPGADTLNAEVDAIFAAAARKVAPQEALPSLRALHEYAFDAPVNQLVDFTAGEHQYTAVAAGKTLTLLGADGKELWRKTLNGDIGALCYWEKAGLLVAGDRSEMIRAFTPDGTERWSVRSESAPEFIASNKTFWFKKVYPGVYALAAAELIPGQSRLFAGSTGTVEVITPDGKVENRFWQDYGPVTDFAVFEAEKNRPARLFASRAFGAWPTTWSILGEEGKLVSSNSWMLENHSGAPMNKYGFSGVGKHSLRSLRLVPDGEQLLLGVFDGAQNGAMLWAYNGRVSAGVNLDSGEVANAVDYAARALSPRNICSLAAADLDGDGRQEIVVATARKLLYIFDDRFQLRKCVELKNEPAVLAVAPGKIAVGLTGGEVRVFDPNGKAIASCRAAGPVTALKFTANGLLIGAGDRLTESAF